MSAVLEPVAPAPDYISPVIGWRMWYAVDSGGVTSLSSVLQRTIWPHGCALVAACRRGRLPLWPLHRANHDAPGSGCSCGIYAARVATLGEYLPEQLRWTRLLPIVGRVALWGVVHEHERGWRASMAYPVNLFVPIAELRSGRAAAVISDLRRYGVPVRGVDGGSSDAVIREVSALSPA